MTAPELVELPSSDAQASEPGGLTDELTEIGLRYAGNAVKLALAHPEVVLVIGGVLLAHKKSPAVRAWVSKLIGVDRSAAGSQRELVAVRRR